jgi:hypothetical protein
MSTFLRISVFTLAAVGLYAQTTTPVASSPVISTATTGMIAVAEGQEARLNVLNPGVLPPAATGLICAAQVSFLSDDGKVIKTSTLTINPGSAGGLVVDGDIELKLVGAERREVRATISSACKLIGTVEVFDRFTGRTQAVLGGFHAVPNPVASSAPAN